MAISEDLHAIPKLFGDAVEQLGKLVQNEAQLAKAELAERSRRRALVRPISGQPLCCVSRSSCFS
jgi:hypothetical protein